MIVIIIFSFLVRIYNLDLFPLNHDEATWSLPSIVNFDKFIGIPVSCFHGYIQPFFSYLVFLSSRIFLSPIYIVRIPSVIIGTATVILLYLLAKEMYGKKAALISSLLLCFLPWHVIQSRIGVSLILTPFFGSLIFLALVKSINKKSNVWFLLSWFFLGIGSFYTYQVSLVFVPVFLVSLLFLKRDLYWLKPKLTLAGAVIFGIILFPLIYLHLIGQIDQYLGKVYRMYYQDGNFDGTIVKFLSKTFINFKGNILNSFKGIFFSKACILNAQALNYPLLINIASFFIIIFSVITSICQKKTQDKILLIWSGLGYIGAISAVRFYDARYYMTIIVCPLLILIGKFIAGIFDWVSQKVSFKRGLLLFTGIIFFLILIGSEFWQLIDYYYTAPFDLEECRFNSYGCKESAQYLSNIPDIEKHAIVIDSSMESLFVYLQYYLPRKNIKAPYLENIKRRETMKETYYVIWAPQTHPKDYRGGEFSWLYNDFRQRHPNAAPLKTIFYPNGLAALQIFKVKNNEI